MSAASRSPLLSDWRDMASFGEQIVSATSLAAQHDRILAMLSGLVEGDVDVWLQENLFRLPNLEEAPLFPEQPALQGMQRALKAGRLRTKQKRGKSNVARGTWAAVPIVEQGLVLGALQVSRPNGPEFKQDELDLLERLAGVIAASLIASHRLAVERFRLNQLNLVSEVSAQIANVLKVDELASRVTQLIQRTFHYYYVAIFTLRDNSTSLRFRSSAMAPRPGKRKAKVALEVKLGEGLIGQAAAEGERIIVDDVRQDPSLSLCG
jgi:GAF domain-containing protein